MLGGVGGEFGGEYFFELVYVFGWGCFLGLFGSIVVNYFWFIDFFDGIVYIFFMRVLVW